MQRPDALTRFIDATRDAILASAPEGEEARATATRIFSALDERAGAIETAAPETLPMVLVGGPVGASQLAPTTPRR